MIKAGSNTIDKVYIGSEEVSKIYIGNNLIYENEVPGLIHHWKFDEGIGQSANDSKGSKHLNLFNTIWYNGHIGSNSLYFDGTGYTISANQIQFSGTELTLCFWSKTKIYSSSYQSFIAEANQNSNAGFIWLSRRINSNDLYQQFATGSTRITHNVSNFFLGYDEQWIHIGVSYDYTNRTIKYYRNGYLVIQQTFASTILFPDQQRNKYLGCYSTSSHKINDGYIDDFRIYNRALDESEILKIYNSSN